MSYQPPFRNDDEIMSLIADIALKVGKIDTYDQLSRSPQLRKENRIKTIHASLAIENNSLSLEQVTAVLEGKHVLAPMQDVLEVQNAIETYNTLESLDPYSLKDLLKAHGILMKGLKSDAGCIRSDDVGVITKDNVVIHYGTPHAYVAQVLNEVFGWLCTKSVHPLISSCVFHYELEYIHPFSDGNGRTGRLWQTAILGYWNPLFYWLPVETLIKQKQNDYYDVLHYADSIGDCTEFIKFMLTMIDSALDDVLAAQGNMNTIQLSAMSVQNMKDQVITIVIDNPTISIREIAQELNLTKRKVERLMAELKREGKISRVGSPRAGAWVVNE